MIPFNPEAIHVHWFHAWREQLGKAKELRAFGLPNDAYCRAAVIAHAQYVCYAAIELVKSRERYL